MPDIVVWDLETTGLDVDEDRIVQFAAVRLDESGEEVDSLKLLIDPFPTKIPAEATAIHGITEADVEGAPHFAGETADAVLDFIGDADLCGHNMIAYDLPLLLAELKRCGRAFVVEGRRLFDTQEIFRHDVPHTLEGALRHYANQTMGDDAHDALADAQACASVLRMQMASMIETPDELAAISLGDRITLDGKIVRDDDGDACLSFGKHRGQKLRDVPKGFLRWMLGKDFTAETKAVVRRYV
jgi:DNA polymerase-3 subunit epsilon